MKVLFIIDSLVKGGKERRFVELLKGIDRTEIDYRYILLTDIIDFDVSETLKVKPIIIKRKIRKDPSVFFKILSICKEFRPDVINAWGFMPAFYVFPIAYMTGTKFVNSMIIDAPAVTNLRTKLFSKIIFHFSDVITSNSYAGLDSYKVGRGKNKKVEVIRNGFDFSRINNIRSSSEMKKELGIEEDKLVVGMVAAFRYHKDYISIITAAKAVLDKRNDVVFVLVGDGPDLKSSKEAASGYSGIVFTGKRSDIESIVNACDLCVLSTYTEGISNSIIEYMALGKAVVATDGGGTKELVEDGITGFLVPQRSPLVLSERIIQLLEDVDLRKKMGAKGKEKIINRYDMGKMVSKYLDLFCEKKG